MELSCISLSYFGSCKNIVEPDLFDLLKNHGISLSGESSIRSAMLVMNDGTYEHRNNVVDAIVVYNNRKYAAELLSKVKPDNWKIEVFCCVKAMMSYSVTSLGAFSNFKKDIPMVILRLGKPLDIKEGYNQ